jgi:hypothetical protein
MVSILLRLAFALAGCTQATPAPTVIPTDTAAPVPSPTTPPATEPTADLEGFVIQLIQAIDSKNFDQLQALMGDTFIFGFWLGEGVSYPPAEAVEQLRTNYLGPDTDPVFDRDVDLGSILGTDPGTIAGPEANIVEMFFADGWGLEGNDEAILFIAQRPDGSFYWHSVLLALGGFSGQPGVPGEGVVETDVQYVRPVEDVSIYSGPGTGFELIGMVAGGQTALVTGASPDGLWWRVVCPDDSIGSCWVQADKAPPADSP